MTVLPRRADEAGLTLQAAAPMFAADPALEIVLWNEGAEALLGFTEGEVLGKRCYEVLGCPGSVRRLCCSDRGDGRETGRPRRAPAFEHEISAKSGERIWVSVTTLLAGSRGDVPLCVHLLQDLKRQRQIEELLRQVASTASRLSSSSAGNGDGKRFPRLLHGLTERERDVVRLLARGSSTADIAAGLGITPRTARNHIQNVLCKLDVHSRLEAVAYASARGLV